MPRRARPRNTRLSAFTLMELLVVIAIIIILATIADVVYARIKMSSNKAVAVNSMRQLGAAMIAYAQNHDGYLAVEDAAGKDTWEAAMLPAADKAWYNAAPRQLGLKGLGDFAREQKPQAFYSPENLLYLPGANYPPLGRRFTRPYFAIAINTKLFRKASDGKKPDLRMGQVEFPSRTVMFLEQGLPGELRAHATIGARDYDGSPKGSAKSFVARYSGRGVILFMDGNAGEFAGSDLLSSSGEIIWSAESDNINTSIFWTADPKEDPNRASP
jgi:type II secretory pathway pseudopilin PulG